MKHSNATLKLSSLTLVLASCFCYHQMKDTVRSAHWRTLESQDCLNVSDKNRLWAGIQIELEAPAATWFPKSTRLANYLLSPMGSKSLAVNEPTRHRYKEVLSRLNNHESLKPLYNGKGLLTKQQQTNLGVIDDSLFYESIRFLDERQQQKLLRKLVYTKMATLGFGNWLRDYNLLDQRTLQSLDALLRKEHKTAYLKCQELSAQHVDDIVRILGDSDKKRLLVLLGDNRQWSELDSHLEYVQSVSVRAKPRFRPAATLSELTSLIDVSYVVDLDGSICQNKRSTVGSQRATLVRIIDGDAYGGVEPTSDQIKSLIHSPPIPIPSQNRFARELELLRHRASELGFDAIVDEYSVLMSELDKKSIEAVENTLLPHQLEYLREVLLRRSIGVLGLDTTLLQIADFDLDPLTQKKIENCQREYRKRLIAAHEKAANMIWTKIQQTFPQIALRIRKEVPGFRFDEIEHPTLLFRQEPSRQ